MRIPAFQTTWKGMYPYWIRLETIFPDKKKELAAMRNEIMSWPTIVASPPMPKYTPTMKLAIQYLNNYKDGEGTWDQFIEYWEKCTEQQKRQLNEMVENGE